MGAPAAEKCQDEDTVLREVSQDSRFTCNGLSWALVQVVAEETSCKRQFQEILGDF